MECPICKTNFTNFITFDCNHKICLDCYNNCILNSHTKCCLCRKENVFMEHMSLKYFFLKNKLKVSERLNEMLNELKKTYEIEFSDLKKKYEKTSEKYIILLTFVKDNLEKK
jgi:hypothetical protein